MAPLPQAALHGLTLHLIHFTSKGLDGYFHGILLVSFILSLCFRPILYIMGSDPFFRIQ